MKGLWLAAVLIVSVVTASSSVEAAKQPANDYPTDVRADYIFACMQTNGQTRDVLEKCSCSIDAVAAILPYTDYESAQTIMMMQQSRNRYRELYSSYGPYRKKVRQLKRAQVEGELRCF